MTAAAAQRSRQTTQVDRALAGCGDELERLAREAGRARSRRGAVRARALRLRSSVDDIVRLVDKLERDRLECREYFDDNGYFAICRLGPNHRGRHAASCPTTAAADELRRALETCDQLGAVLRAGLTDVCAGGDLDVVHVRAAAQVVTRSVRRHAHLLQSLTAYPPPGE